MDLSILEAIGLLQSGEVVALPTETVYGLAASLAHPSAIKKIFVLKGRPLKNPLIIHLADLEMIDTFVEKVPPLFEELTKTFWPGPLTLVLPVLPSKVPALIRAGLPTAAFRIPALEATRDIIRATGPLVMPSANLSGKPSATSSLHIEEDFGKDFPLVNLGSSKKGVESTILLFKEEEWWIGRLGSLSAEEIEKEIGYRPKRLEKEGDDENPLCPGLSFRHYAPNATLIFEGSVEESSAPFVLGFKERIYPKNKQLLLLGSLKSPESVAENLYSLLRELDREKAEEAWVDFDFPKEGLWKTIEERLKRAAEK